MTALLHEIADDPARFRLTKAFELSAVWAAVAGHGDASLKEVWEKAASEDTPSDDFGLRDSDSPMGMGQAARDALQILASSTPEEEALRLYLNHYAQGDQTAAFEFGKRVSPRSQKAIALLVETDVRLGDFARIIAEKLAEPVLVPKLMDLREP